MLLLRVTGFTRQRDGFIYNTTLNKDTNEVNNYGGRFMLVFNPSDNLTIELRGDYYKQDEDGGVQEVVSTASSCTLPFACSSVRRSTPSRRKIRGTASSTRTSTRSCYREVSGYSAKVEYDMGGYVLTSISAQRESGVRIRSPTTTAARSTASTRAAPKASIGSARKCG